MNSKHVSQSRRVRRVSTRIFLFISFMLAIPVGLQSGYAHEALLHQTSSAHTASPESSQSLPPAKIAASRISNPTSPSFCYQVAFNETDYTVGDYPLDVEVGEFNGDGIPDMITVNYNSNDVSVLLGNGNGTFASSTQYPTDTHPYNVRVADLFGDRVDDLVVVNASTSDVSYMQGEGDGTFYPPYHFSMGYMTSAVAVADLNNDSWSDLVTVSGTSNKVSIRLNDGVGDFEPAAYIAVSGAPSAVTIGDLNGDGTPDLVTANSDAHNVSVLLGNGNGTFQAPSNFAAGHYLYHVEVGDFNDDGILDLAVPNNLSNTVSVLLGNGDGSFQAPNSFAVANGPNDVEVGDFNDDGKLDLAVQSNAIYSISVLVNYGDGSFQPAVNIPMGYAIASLAVGDLNGDGKSDLATAKDLHSTLTVLLNSCVSVPNTPTPVPVPTDTSTPAFAATDSPTPLPTQTAGGPTATPQACSIHFTDVPSANTFYPFVRCLACRGIIGGYSCGGPGEPCNAQSDPYFRPGSPVTRGQLAKIVSNAAGFSDTPTGQTFQDVPPSSTFYLFGERLASRGVMAGYTCGGAGEPCVLPSNLPYFRPGSGATRGQLTKIVSNAAGFSDPAPATYTFTDVPAGSTFHPYVERLLLNRPGVTGGYSCGGPGEPCDTQSRPYFRPSSPLTRGQTSKIVGNTFFPSCQTP